MVVWVLPLIPFPTGSTARSLFQLALGHPPMGIRKAESGAGYAALGSPSCSAQKLLEVTVAVPFELRVSVTISLPLRGPTALASAVMVICVAVGFP